MKLLLLTLLALATAACAAAAVADVPIRLALKQDPAAVQALEDTLYAVSSPQSKRYGHHLTALEIGHIIGRSYSELRTITKWLMTDSEVGALKGSVRVHETRDYIDVIVPQAVASEMVGDHLQRQRDGSRASAGIGRFSSHPAAALIDFAIHLDQKHNQAIRLSAESASEFANWQRLPSRSERRARYAIDHLNKQKAERAAAKRLPKKQHGRVSAPNDNSGTPANQRAAYGVPASLTCTNPKNHQMIWGTGTYGFTASDLQSFYSQMNIPASELNLLTVTDYPGVEGGDNWGEGTLDISLISSIAPGVLTFVSNTDNSQSAEEGDGFGPAMLSWMTGLIQNASTQGIPNVISLSLGSLSWDSCNLLCEGVAESSSTTYAQCQSYMQQQRQVCMYPDSAGLDRMNIEFAKLGTMGVTVMAATGDGGSHFSFQFFGTDPIGTLLNTVACKMNSPTFPAESPYVVGVGGTDWSTGVTTPVAWAASGGGFSWRYPVPSYQSAAVSAYLSSTTPPPNSAFNRSNRAYPDVAALAINVPIVFSGSLSAAAGTSCSAPEFSALMSLLNDVRMNAGLSPLGFVLPAFYSLAANPTTYAQCFFDMSSGSSDCDSNGECCNEGTGFAAATGWDPTTGLGSPLFAGLQAQLGNNDFLKMFQ